MKKADFTKLFKETKEEFGNVLYQVYKDRIAGRSSNTECLLLMQSVIPEANELTLSPFGFKLELSDGKMHIYLKCTKKHMSVKLIELKAGTIKEKICLCKYCGEPSGSKNPDILCEDCRDLFGHSRYSDL